MSKPQSPLSEAIEILVGVSRMGTTLRQAATRANDALWKAHKAAAKRGAGGPTLPAIEAAVAVLTEEARAANTAKGVDIIGYLLANHPASERLVRFLRDGT